MNNTCVLAVDDSMKGMYKSGDFVELDTRVQSYKHDGPYAFQLDGEKFISPLQRIPGEGLIVLLASYGYEDRTITEDMDFQIVGKVVKGWVGKDV